MIIQAIRLVYTLSVVYTLASHSLPGKRRLASYLRYCLTHSLSALSAPSAASGSLPLRLKFQHLTACLRAHEETKMSSNHLSKSLPRDLALHCRWNTNASAMPSAKTMQIDSKVSP